MLSSVYAQQRAALRAYGSVINSASYRISTRERVRIYNALEVPTLRHCLVDRPLPGLSYTPDDLRTQLSKTTQGLRYNIEIAEEGNTKAIRVFTLVTIIFLPLPFISSVFGMNTTDIRNMGSSQRLFWAIAIPVTALIGGVSLLVAYYGTRIWDKFRKTGKLLFDAEEKMTLPRPLRSRKQKPKDEEKMVDGETVERMLPRQGIAGTRRRRTGFDLKDGRKKEKPQRERVVSDSRVRTGTLGDTFFR
jgi:hypothetical protein